ncbi:MAG: sigma-54 dependent transcriptional regulator [Myxococcota bacterium]
MVERQVLIIDDEPSWVKLLTRELERQSYSVRSATDGAQGRRIVEEDGFDGVVLLDLRLPDTDGMDLLEPLQEANAGLKIIMMTAHGTSADEIEARRRGVHLFVSKNEGIARIVGAVQSAFEVRDAASEASHLRQIVKERYQFGKILTRSTKMQKVFDTLLHVVDSKVTVLLQGESGTGKELVARALHYEGPRRKGPFVAVNVAGIPETLLESELFGHERGAFTGAVAMKKGKFELADTGTLFLDEIGEMPLHLQAKLLRVLQERQVERVGGTAPRGVDVRIISATHRNLLDMVREKRFREDLYYRLAVFPVYLPALREREGDIPLLARHFLEKACEEEGKPPMTLAASALTAIERYAFPGNVRELENVISRAVLVATGTSVKRSDLPSSVLDKVGADTSEATDVAPSVYAPVGPRTLPEVLRGLYASLTDLPTIDDVEAMLVERALELAQGNVGEAAKALGMSRATVYRRLKKARAASRRQLS